MELSLRLHFQIRCARDPIYDLEVQVLNGYKPSTMVCGGIMGIAAGLLALVKTFARVVTA